ncbi:MAG: GH25 family lysozyme [Bacteroidia bacterium]
MKKVKLLTAFIIFNLSVAISPMANAQTCASGGCPINDTNSTGGLYPSGVFSTSSSSWTTVSAYMNAGNYTLFNVTNGDTYQWTYCSDFGGTQNWDAALTLYNKATGATLCWADNCGRTNCVNAPYISWTATFTGVVKLLTTISTCSITNTGTAPWSTLVWRDSSGTVPVGGTSNVGIDVSHYQSPINWTQVAGGGVTYAWAKATEGTTYVDPDYTTNATSGVAAGVYMGAYHFAHPDTDPSTSGAVSEANHFLSVAQPYIIACELPPMLDYETDVSASMSGAQQTAWVESWMNTVYTATGIMPILYTSGSIANQFTSALASYCKLWIATDNGSATTIPPSPPPPTPSTYDQAAWYPNWSFNQYSWTTTVPGITSGGVDADIFNGNITQLRTLMGCPTSGIDQNSLNNSFVIYPNPNAGTFHIDYTGVNGEAIVNVYDVNGKLVLSQTMNGKTNIDASNLSDGIYNVNITNTDGVINKRIVIVR